MQAASSSKAAAGHVKVSFTVMPHHDVLPQLLLVLLRCQTQNRALTEWPSHPSADRAVGYPCVQEPHGVGTAAAT